MKAIVVEEHGGPEVLSYEDVEIPEPGPGVARVRLAALMVTSDPPKRNGIILPSSPGTINPDCTIALPPRHPAGKVNFLYRDIVKKVTKASMRRCGRRMVLVGPTGWRILRWQERFQPLPVLIG